MGAVSPNGVGTQPFSRGGARGTVGVRRISHFDSVEIPVQIAGEVRDFDELAWVEKRERKHVSRVLPLALAAASEAFEQAGIDPRLPWRLREAPALRRDRGLGRRRRRNSPRSSTGCSFIRTYRNMSLFCVPTGVMGTLLERLKHPLRIARAEPGDHDRLHLFDRCDGLLRAARSSRDGRTACSPAVRTPPLRSAS